MYAINFGYQSGVCEDLWALRSSKRRAECLQIILQWQMGRTGYCLMVGRNNLSSNCTDILTQKWRWKRGINLWYKQLAWLSSSVTMKGYGHPLYQYCSQCKSFLFAAWILSDFVVLDVLQVVSGSIFSCESVRRIAIVFIIKHNRQWKNVWSRQGFRKDGEKSCQWED